MSFRTQRKKGAKEWFRGLGFGGLKEWFRGVGFGGLGFRVQGFRARVSGEKEEAVDVQATGSDGDACKASCAGRGNSFRFSTLETRLAGVEAAQREGTHHQGGRGSQPNTAEQQALK